MAPSYLFSYKFKKIAGSPSDFDIESNREIQSYCHRKVCVFTTGHRIILTWLPGTKHHFHAANRELTWSIEQLLLCQYVPQTT